MLLDHAGLEPWFVTCKAIWKFRNSRPAGFWNGIFLMEHQTATDTRTTCPHFGSSAKKYCIWTCFDNCIPDASLYVVFVGHFLLVTYAAALLEVVMMVGANSVLGSQCSASYRVLCKAKAGSIRMEGCTHFRSGDCIAKKFAYGRI